MAVRKASAYSGKRARPFTRVSKTKHKAYIKVNPNNKIAKYQQGSGKDFRSMDLHLEGLQNNLIKCNGSAIR